MWTDILDVLLRVGAAFLLALPLGCERELAARTVGLRTFPLVAMGACAYLLIGQEALGESAEARARILAGLVTGIGFVGGGAILKGRRDVRGGHRGQPLEYGGHRGRGRLWPLRAGADALGGQPPHAPAAQGAPSRGVSGPGARPGLVQRHAKHRRHGEKRDRDCEPRAC